MKKLILKIFLIAFIIELLILLLPVNKRLFYQGLKDDCSNRSIWIYDRIFENEKPIDLAFFGSSHILNGINDDLIEKKIHINTSNIGYCRLGENLVYVLLKEVVKTKQLKTIVIEVREDEDLYSHPIFPYIAETKDVLLATPLFNKKILSDIYKHSYYKLEVIKNLLLNNIENKEIHKDNFIVWSSPDTASKKLLSEIKEKHNKKKIEQNTFERDFHLKYPRTYLEKINTLCIEKGIKIFFLYLPSYGSNVETPKEINTYLKYGTVLIPPNEIYENPANWHDEAHLNQSGSNQLSNWVADELNKQMQH